MNLVADILQTSQRLPCEAEQKKCTRKKKTGEALFLLPVKGPVVHEMPHS